jgi:hypothetical protein
MVHVVMHAAQLTSAAEFTKVQRQVEGLEGRHALLAKELAAFKVVGGAGVAGRGAHQGGAFEAGAGSMRRHALLANEPAKELAKELVCSWVDVVRSRHQQIPCTAAVLPHQQRCVNADSELSAVPDDRKRRLWQT